MVCPNYLDTAYGIRLLTIEQVCATMLVCCPVENHRSFDHENYTYSELAKNLMCDMKKGDFAFFYHSNCKVPGVVGVMEIVQEHSTDGSLLKTKLANNIANPRLITESAFDPEHPYYDPKSKRDDPKWVVVHVEYRRKLEKQVTLQDLKSHGQTGKPLENLQMIKQSRLSVSSVTPAQWKYILELAGEEPQEEFTKKESSEENESSEKEESSDKEESSEQEEE